MFQAHVLTILPDMFPGPLGHSVVGRAQNKAWQLHVHDIRQYATDKHRNVDDTPYGGGAGMVMRADVIGRSIDALPAALPKICFSPRGQPLTQQDAANIATLQGITLLCGRFEGIDERVYQHYNIKEVSIGDFILTGGEIPAMVLLDSVVRLLPDVLGNAQSCKDESFSNGLLEYPQYTRPFDWHGYAVPDVLLSGHHDKIATWRQEQSKEITKNRRPDLWCAYKARTEEAKQSDAL